MPINPMVGGSVRVDALDVASPELGGFAHCYLHRGASGSQHDAEVVYYPSLPILGNLRSRHRVVFGIRYTPRQRADGGYIQLPFYYDLQTEIDEDSHTIYDHLFLYLDRDVHVDLPPNVIDSMRTGAALLVDFPRDFDRIRIRGTTTYIVTPLRVWFHRFQHPGDVPQTPMDCFRLGTRQRYWLNYPRRSDLVHTALEARTEETSTGATLRFTTTVSQLGEPPFEDPVVTDLAVLHLDYFHMEYPCGYAIRVDEEASEARPMQVYVLISRNVRARLYVNAVGRDLYDLGGSFGLAQWLRHWFGLHIHLHMRKAGNLRSIPRPDNRYEFDADSVSNVEVPDFLEVLTLPNRRREVMLDALSLGVGFIPVIGDLFDIGELVKAVVTGTDFQGRSVGDGELALMALAILPTVPSAIRHLDGAIRATRETIETSATIEAIRRRVADARPAFARALRAGSGDGALQALLDSTSYSRALCHGGIRDPAVLRHLRGIR